MALGTQQQAVSPTPSTIHSGSCLILASVLANTESLRTFVGEKRIVERKIGSFGTYWRHFGRFKTKLGHKTSPLVRHKLAPNSKTIHCAPITRAAEKIDMSKFDKQKQGIVKQLKKIK